jgi:hypothetical protein
MKLSHSQHFCACSNSKGSRKSLYFRRLGGIEKFKPFAKNLNFSGIHRKLISYYVWGLQYMPPRVLAFWGKNPAGAIIYFGNQPIVDQ